MKIFKGPKHTKQDHIDAIALTSNLMKMLKNEGPVAVEPHLEDPGNSTVFSEYPNLLKNEALIALICDTLTLLVVSSGTLDTHARADRPVIADLVAYDRVDAGFKLSAIGREIAHQSDRGCAIDNDAAGTEGRAVAAG